MMTRVTTRLDPRLRERDPSCLALYEMTTPRATFAEDVAIARSLGLGGMGICAFKLDGRRLASDLAVWERCGLDATFCLPSPDSYLPQPLAPGARDPRDRLRAMCESIDLLAEFGPAGIVCTTGPLGDLDPGMAREQIVSGLREVAAHAGAHGLRVALEPLHPSMSRDWTTISTLGEGLELVAAAGASNLGVLADVWHLAESPELVVDIRRAAELVFDVHVSDRRVPTRGWCDRALPGAGSIAFEPILDALEGIEYRGWYELEIFSDDGMFGTAYPDSLWRLPPEELVRSARDAFLDVASQAATGTS